IRGTGLPTLVAVVVWCALAGGKSGEWRRVPDGTTIRPSREAGFAHPPRDSSPCGAGHERATTSLGRVGSRHVRTSLGRRGGPGARHSGTGVRPATADRFSPMGRAAAVPWPDFIPRLGGWILGTGVPNPIVGYLWRYLGGG